MYTYPLDPVMGVDPLGLWAFAIPAILEGINWLFWGSAAAGGAVLATSGDSEQSKTNTESLTKCEEKKTCPPCIPPTGTICVGSIHTEHDHKGKKPHFHTYKMNQNPKNCECNWNKRKKDEHTLNSQPPGIQPCIAYGYKV